MRKIQPAYDQSDEPENLDRLFTPEVVARLDRISQDMEAGKVASTEEVHKYLDDVRKEWLKDHAG